MKISETWPLILIFFQWQHKSNHCDSCVKYFLDFFYTILTIFYTTLIQNVVSFKLF